jgi:predicted PilT family ATPase
MEKEFQGFNLLSATPVPDQFFDELLPELGLAEIRVLLFIVRCTVGSRRQTADLSLKQMLRGIEDSDGVVVAPPVGLSKATLCRALASLRARKVIVAERRRSADLGNEATRYRLNTGFF